MVMVGIEWKKSDYMRGDRRGRVDLPPGVGEPKCHNVCGPYVGHARWPRNLSGELI